MIKKGLFFLFLVSYTLPEILAPLVPQFYWNSTDSGPKGVYLQRELESLSRGDKVVFDIPSQVLKESFPEDAKETRPLIKAVRALPGDEYCITEAAIYINGAWVGPIYETSTTHRPLPKRRGCFVVKPNHFLPISSYHPRSFDGRYFGEIDFKFIRGEAIPVLTYD